MKRCIKRLSIALCMVGSFVLNAQTTWYFGNRGSLKFTNNSPTSSPWGASNFNAVEASAVLLDENENVICYSDGIRIWNGSNVEQSSALKCDPSTTQGVAIVPIPGNPGKAFIFTTTIAHNLGNYNSNFRGLRAILATYTNNGTTTAPNYSISLSGSDLNLTGETGLMSERITVTSDNGGGFWVLTHGAGISGGNVTETHNFYAFHVDCSTLTVQDLIKTQNKIKSDMSGAGLSPHNLNSNSNDAAGQMKFNAMGTKIACLMPYRAGGSISNYLLYNPTVQMYDFNKSTGVVSNPKESNLGFTNTGNTRDGGAYGVEFSASSNYVFITSTQVTAALTNMKSAIYRYELNLSSNVITNKIEITSSNIVNGVGKTFGGLLRGPDGYIYSAIRNDNANNNQILTRVTNTDAATPGVSQVWINGSSNIGTPNVVWNTKPQTTLTVSGPSIICKGSAPTYTFGYSGLVPAYHYIAVYGSNANGDAVNASGTVISDQSQSYYYKEYAYWLTPGTPPSSIVASQLATVANCGQYYTAILSTSDKCQSNGSLIIAKATTRINCITPSFNTLIDETNENFCKLTSTPIEQNRLDDPAYGFSWRVEGLTSGGTFLLNNPPAWWSAPSKYVNTYREFNDYTIHYTGTISIPNPNPPVLTNGQFIYGHTYKITRSVWDNVCTTGATSVVTLTPVHHKNSTGSHFIQTIENFDGMDLTMVNTNSTTTGVENLNGKDDAFYVYPNPSTGVFTIELSNEEKAIMEVFDVTGKTIKTVQLTKNDRYTLDLSDYAKGMYLIKVNGEVQQMKKIILE